MITGKCKLKNKTAYFLLGLVAISALQIAATGQPAMGQCVEPAQEPTTSMISPIETILTDNSYHHLGNDIKENLIPKEPEGITYTKTFFLDSGFESPKLGLIAKSVSPYETNATEYLDRIYINDVEVALLNCFFKEPSLPLFNIDTKLEDDLNKGIVPEELKNIFKNNGFPLSNEALIIPWKENENTWTISDPSSSQKFTISKEGENLNVYPPAYSPQPSESAEVDISFDPDLLKIGNNTIKITSGSNKDSSNYDDFEFYQLTLKGIRKTGWFLSGKVLVGDKPIFPARVYVYRHGPSELVSSLETTRPGGSYSLKLSNGEYDVKAEAWNEFSNPQYDTKTIIIDNSNVTLDFKASEFIAILPTIFVLLIIPFIVPSVIVGLTIAASIYIFTKKRKIVVLGFVSGTAGTCLINLLMTGIAWLSGSLFQSSFLGFPLIITLSLLLSAAIAFVIVTVPIILLNRRKE